MSEQRQEEPPVFVVHDGQRWARTDVRKGSDLVDGSGWIAMFNSHLEEAQKRPKDSQPPRARRLLRQTATDGDVPHFWGSAAPNLANLGLRNEVLEEMRPDRLFGPNADMSRGPGRMVKLPTGEDVIFWFNVGPPGHPRDRVYVTSAYCPHQGVCLNTGELRDIEDVAGCKRAMIRCPRHHKTYDLRTGESLGNAEQLKVYPCRFEHGHWYVAVGPAPDAPDQAAAAAAAARAAVDGMPPEVGGSPGDADVDMACAQEPLWKKLRSEAEDALAQGQAPPAAVKPTVVEIPGAAPYPGRQLAYAASIG